METSTCMYCFIGILVFSAMNKFKQLDTKATTTSTDTDLESTHQNSITQIVVYSVSQGSADVFSTIGVDGRVAIWACKSLEAAIAGLKFS